MDKVLAPLLIVALITVGSLQAIAASSLANSTKYVDTYNQLKWGAIASFIAAFVLLLVYSITMKYYEHKDAKEVTPGIITFILFIAGGVLLTVAGYGANAAINVKCDIADPAIGQAWNMSTVSAVTGFVAVILVLLLKGQGIKSSICPPASKPLPCPPCPGTQKPTITGLGIFDRKPKTD
jgi:glycerol uptake facilitator-like aquaporin